MKYLFKLAHWMDNLTLIILTFALFYCLFQGAWSLSLLCLIAKGVWCCSMSLVRILKILGDEDLKGWNNEKL